MECRNCGETIENNFCPICGQSKRVDRITWSSIWNDFSNNFLGFNSGFMFTVKRLSIAPGNAVRGYLEGHRKNFMQPVQFYLLILTLYFLINNWLGIDFLEIQNEYVPKDTGVEDEKKKEVMNKVNELIYSNFKLLVTLSIPFIALVLKWMYRKSGFNFVELLVFSFYIGSIQYLISEVLSVIYLSTKSISIHYTIATIITTIYTIYAIMQFFEKKGILAAIKAFAAYLFAIILFFIFFSIIVFAATILLYK